MIRETLDPGATLVSEIYNRYFSYLMLYERPTTGASISAQNCSLGMPFPARILSRAAFKTACSRGESTPFLARKSVLR